MSIEIKTKIKELNCCVIIPTYNNEQTLANVIADVCLYTDRIIVVNDGSTDSTEEILKQFDSITICSYSVNKGKGYALQTGFEKAVEKGFTYAVTIDSDGQHFASDIPLFIEKIEENPEALLIGSRNLQQENMPGKNTFANKFSNFWFRLETGQKLDDTQSGFRLYPLQQLKNINFFTKKYEFELEVLVRSAWKGIRIISIPINVYYAPPEERISHFKPLRDFTRISILNMIFVFIAFLWVKPFAFVRTLTKENIKRFFKEEVLASSDSDSVIVFSVMLGIFMGIVPVWGYQMIIAFILAHRLKLNKVITLVASNISIPPMIPFILFGSFALGSKITGYPLNPAIHDVTFETVKQNLYQYITGSIALAILCSLISGFAVFIAVSLFRKKKSA